MYLLFSSKNSGSTISFQSLTNNDLNGWSSVSLYNKCVFVPFSTLTARRNFPSLSAFQMVIGFDISLLTASCFFSPVLIFSRYGSNNAGLFLFIAIITSSGKSVSSSITSILTFCSGVKSRLLVPSLSIAYNL